MSNEFSFCPMCGSKKIISEANHWKCPDCGLSLYNNVASAVGVILCDTDGSVLFEVRAKEPRKGFLALPGGFCDADETAEEAVLRECKEEAGVVPENVRYIASFPNTYEYKSIVYKTCDLFFSAEVQTENGKSILEKLTAQEGEVTGFVTKKITCLEDIQQLPMAFDSAKKALTVWFKKGK